jgi:hypothetical protein
MTSGALPETASAELHAASVEHMLVQYLSPDDEDSHRWSRSQVRERVRARGGGGRRHHPQASHP